MSTLPAPRQPPRMDAASDPVTLALVTVHDKIMERYHAIGKEVDAIADSAQYTKLIELYSKRAALFDAANDVIAVLRGTDAHAASNSLERLLTH